MPEKRKLRQPAFAQPQSTPDPSLFKVPHASDAAAYQAIDELNKEHKLKPFPFPAPRGGAEPVLGLEAVLGGSPAARAQLAAMQARGQVVFHAGGDLGSTKGPQTESLVTDKLASDFDESDPKEVPQFLLLLGDIVYSFGEAQYYYDQFYEPFRDYPAPILACPGNHDGMVSPRGQAQSLRAYLDNFCAHTFEIRPEAGSLVRTAHIQPGVFYTFEAPFVRILTLYSNVLEDPGVIADGGPYTGLGSSQLDYLRAALKRVKKEAFGGALLLAVHHPSYVAGSRHGWSELMTRQIDQACAHAGVWPHAFLSGHAHNYQRFTRTRPDGSQIPYLVCGNIGHGVSRLSKAGSPLRAPQVIQAAGSKADQVVFENYDDGGLGYLRLVATAAQLRIEYHPAGDGVHAKTPDDAVTVDLKARRLVHFTATRLGQFK